MQKDKKVRLLYVLFIIIVLIVINAMGLLKPLHNTVTKIIAPIQNLFYKKASSGQPTELESKTKDELIKKIIELEEEVILLEQKKVLTSLSEDEYLSLKESLEFGSRLESHDLVSANVVGLGTDQDPSLVIINKGSSNSDIREGMPLVSPIGVFVGVVAEVKEHISHVRLITNPHTAVAVAKLPAGGSIGVVQGKFGLSAELSLVPNDMDVAAGDLLYTSGLDPQIPPGLLVGTVEIIEDEPNTQFLRGLVSLKFSPNTLKVINIVVEKNK